MIISDERSRQLDIHFPFVRFNIMLCSYFYHYELFNKISVYCVNRCVGISLACAMKDELSSSVTILLKTTRQGRTIKTDICVSATGEG